MSPDRRADPPPEPYELQAGSPCGGGSAFTLVELLTVMAIIVVITSLVVPAVRSLKAANDITQVAADLSGAISQARSYAITNNTYTWVGFYEENGSQPSTTAGNGRIIIDLVASMDGTLPYDPATLAATTSMNPGLQQISRLLKFDGVHLVKFPTSAGGVTSPGPMPAATIGDTTPSASLTTFTAPLNGTAVYTFTRALEFSPRGEARINNSTSALQQITEIGLQPTHGSVIDAASKNVVSIQVTGVGGNVTVYRK